MSTDTKNLEAMKYNELKALAKERGLDATGTKEDLLARLSDAGVEASTDTDADTTEETQDESETTQEETAAPAPAATISPAVERAETQKAEKALKTDAMKMKAHLEAQPKVSIMIPFEVGENPENGKKVAFHVNLNGYAMDIPRGIYVEVPKQVADIIKARLESEGKIGNEWRIDRDPAKQTALG